MKKRRTFDEKSVLAYMEQGETYAAAKARLDRLWAEGKHPAQVEHDQKRSEKE